MKPKNSFSSSETRLKKGKIKQICSQWKIDKNEEPKVFEAVSQLVNEGKIENTELQALFLLYMQKNTHKASLRIDDETTWIMSYYFEQRNFKDFENDRSILIKKWVLSEWYSDSDSWEVYSEIDKMYENLSSKILNFGKSKDIEKDKNEIGNRAQWILDNKEEPFVLGEDEKWIISYLRRNEVEWNLMWNLSKGEKLAVKFCRLHPQAEPWVLKSVESIWLYGDIKNGVSETEIADDKTKFFVCMLWSNDAHNESNLKEILKQYFLNDTVIGRNDLYEADYVWKLNTLRYYWIWKNISSNNYSHFDNAVKQRYGKYIQEVLALLGNSAS